MHGEFVRDYPWDRKDQESIPRRRKKPPFIGFLFLFGVIAVVVGACNFVS